MRVHGADGTAVEDVALDPQHGEVRRVDVARIVRAGLDVEGADRGAAALAGEPPAAQQRDLAPGVEADAPAEEEIGRVAAAGGEPGAGPAGERERAGAFEEEVALLGEEQVEAGEVDLLFVDLDLGEVGVDGQVGGEVLGQPVLEVAADPPLEVPLRRRHDGPVGGEPAEGVRLQLDGAAADRRFQAGERARGRHLQDAAEGRECARHVGQVRPLVLPAHDPPQVDSPGLLAARAVAQRLEGNRHFDRPAAVEFRRPDRPHRVPVDVGRALVGDLAVGEAADGVGVEDVAVAAVVEGVEQHREGVVLAQLVGVAPHLVGDAALRLALVAAGRHVDLIVVEEDPGVGLLGGRRELERLLLDEAADRRGLGVDGVVEPPVEPRGDPGPHRRDRRRRAGRRRLRHQRRTDQHGEPERTEQARGGRHGRPHRTS